MRATAPRQAAARAATRTTPWAGRLQTALVCVFLTRILYLPPTAAGSRGDTHAIQDGLRAAPGYGGDKSISDGFVQAKSGKLANAPTSLRNAPPFGAIPAATDIAVIDIAVFEIKDLNRQASANGTLRLRPPSGKSGAPLPWCSWRPALQGTGPTSLDPNTPEPRFLDIFQDYLLADDGKGPDAQRLARRGSSQIIPLYTPPSTRRLQARAPRGQLRTDPMAPAPAAPPGNPASSARSRASAGVTHRRRRCRAPAAWPAAG